MTSQLPTHPSQTVLRLEEYNRIEDRPGSEGIKGFVFAGLIVVTGFIGGSAYWAASSSLDGAVVAPASLVVEGNRKTVDHLDGGIVRGILVTDGDLVEAGQTLLELDSTDIDVDLDVIQSQLGDLMVRRARLLAQLEGAEVFGPDDVSETFGIAMQRGDWQAAYDTQKLLFDAEMRTRTAEKDLLTQRIANLQDQMSGLRAQRLSNTRQLEITREELGNLETLLEKGLVAAARVNARRVEVERLKGVDAALQTQEAQARNQISELQLTGIGEQTQRDEDRKSVV